MKHLWLLLIAFFVGCADYDGGQDTIGSAEEDLSSIEGNGDHSTWGVDMTPGLPYPKCTKTGSTSQDCRFVAPYINGNGIFSMPTKYKVILHGPASSAWPTSGAGTFSAVANEVQDIVNSISAQIQLPAINSTPVSVDFLSDFANTGTTIGVNIYAGSVPAGGDPTRTDTFFTLTFNACVSNAIPDGTLPGSYKSCGSAIGIIDLNKMRSKFTGNQLLLNIDQVLAKIVVTGLGAGRQEATQGYPSNRSFNTQESSTGAGVRLIGNEYNQLRCVGSTFRNSNSIFGLVSTSFCPQPN